MVIFSISVSVAVCLGIILTSLLKPSISIKNHNLNLYWIIALFGAIVLLIAQSISISDFWRGLTNKDSINPIKILILFISMSMISIFLDELGFFSHVAEFVLDKTESNQIIIFVVFYLLVSVLTMFTSNDIIILTLTPFIISFCFRSKISPIPYLVSEFIAANTWSMMFIIGNPTNIYIASSNSISFLDYFKKMRIPTLFAGIVEFIILFAIFFKQLKKPIEKENLNVEPLKNKFLTIFGLCVLAITTIVMVLSSYLGFEMYYISLGGFLLLLFVSLIYIIKDRNSKIYIIGTLKRGPYELIPFVIAMFTIVLSLKNNGVTESLSNLLFVDKYNNFSFGYASLLSSNLVNNIPMSVLFSDIIKCCETTNMNKMIYASIIGSNLGAFITPVGALAGIMFLNILKKNQIRYRFLDFLKYGLIVGIPVSFVSFLLI